MKQELLYSAHIHPKIARLGMLTALYYQHNYTYISYNPSLKSNDSYTFFLFIKQRELPLRQFRLQIKLPAFGKQDKIILKIEN
jgi:hypothetical protein